MKRQDKNKDIVVKFISDSVGNKAVAYKGVEGPKNISQETVMRELRDAIGAGDFIGCRVSTNKNDNKVYRYTLKVDELTKGSLKVIVNPKFYQENDPNVVELDKIADRGYSIKYWNMAKLASTCVLVTGVVLGSFAIVVDKLVDFVDDMLEETQTQSIEYVEELNKAREENGVYPIHWNESDKDEFESDRSQALTEYAKNEMSYQFGDYFEEEQGEKGRSF